MILTKLYSFLSDYNSLTTVDILTISNIIYYI